MKSETFFTEAEQKQITEAIQNAETMTSGEIAVMVVDRSDTYPEARILAGTIIGCALSLIIADRFFLDSLWYFVPLAVLFSLFFGWGVRYFPALLRYFVPAGRLDSQVRERAVRAFYEKGLYKTKDKTGVLFFISLFEHKVWLLADEGIYAKITQEKLLEYAADIAKGIKNRTAAEALCREIANVSDILARYFPIQPDDVNELSNKVIIG